MGLRDFDYIVICPDDEIQEKFEKVRSEEYPKKDNQYDFVRISTFNPDSPPDFHNSPIFPFILITPDEYIGGNIDQVRQIRRVFFLKKSKQCLMLNNRIYGRL